MRQSGTVNVGRKAVASRFEPSLDAAGPILKILVDQVARLDIAIANLQRQIPDRTSHPAAMPDHPVPVLGQESEDSVDWIAGLALYGRHHGWVKISNCELKHAQQKLILALVKVIQATRIHVGLAHNSGNPGSVKTLLVKKLKSRSQNAVLGLTLRTVFLSDHSRILSDHSSAVNTYFDGRCAGSRQ